jgi:hypothetical protein
MRADELQPYLTDARRDLFGFPNVRSVGIGFVTEKGKRTKELGIIVGVSEKLPEAMLAEDAIVPPSLKGTGVRLDVVRVGEVVPLVQKYAEVPATAVPDYDCSYFDVMRSGVGLAHYQVTGGTLGFNNKDWLVGVSNNHVVANSNQGQIGDAIMQPSPYCASPNSRLVASLAWFKPIVFLGQGSQCPIGNSWAAVYNYFAQAANRKTRLKALAQLDPFAADTVNHIDLGFIAWANGIPNDEAIERTKLAWTGEVDEAVLGGKYFKSGARTRYTEFTCIQKYMTLSVQYGAGQIAMYEDQDGFDPTSAQPGDSGSGIGELPTVKKSDLVFAGSDTIGIGGPYKYAKAAHDEWIGA